MADRRGLGDFQPGTTGISVSQLSEGESVTVQATGDAFVQSHRLDEDEDPTDAIHLPCIVVEAPDGFVDMGGDKVVTTADDEDPPEYHIINSSSGFYNALVDSMGMEDHNGRIATITARQPEDVYSRYYEIEA